MAFEIPMDEYEAELFGNTEEIRRALDEVSVALNFRDLPPLCIFSI